MKSMDYIAPILMAIAAVFGAVGLYFTNRANNAQSYATGWQGYAKKLEERITALERDLQQRSLVHANELLYKNKRIKDLEGRVDYLEGELIKYQELTSKVDIAKEHIHEVVESSIEDAKK